MTFKVAEVVVWLDPDMGVSSGIYKIERIINSVVLLNNGSSEAEVTEFEVLRPEETLVCGQCGSFHPEILSWTDANTTKYVREIESEAYAPYCPDCEAETQLVPANVFHFDEIERLKK